MKKIITLVCAILLCYISLCSTVFAAPLNSFVMFGDSLSDNGNLLKMLKIIPKSPPYYQGRFTNGRTWAETFGELFFQKYGVNYKIYAYGGATVLYHSMGTDKFISPMLLSGELSQYYLDSMFTDRSQTLFGIWIGANDYLYEMNPDIEGLTSALVGNIVSNIEALIARGAKNFFVMNLPDLGLTPFAHERHMESRLHVASTMNNQKLFAAVNILRNKHPDVKFAYIDIYTLLHDVVSNPDKYNREYRVHVTDVVSACWTGDVFGLGEQVNALNAEFKKALTKNMTPIENFDASNVSETILSSVSLRTAYAVGQKAAVAGKRCENPENHLFWDDVHPAHIAHDILGKMVFDQVSQSSFEFA